VCGMSNWGSRMERRVGLRVFESCALMCMEIMEHCLHTRIYTKDISCVHEDRNKVKESGSNWVNKRSVK
jgi:hypothetical protein